MTDIIVDLLDDDDDDCVPIQVTQAAVLMNCNEKSSKDRSRLYHKVIKESKLLADFIEKSLSLEKSSYMFNTLENVLLGAYYKVEKSVRDGSKIQRALQRANNLLYSDPDHKFTHIKDLCDVLKASQVKKKVPFVTLTTDLKSTDNKTITNYLKRNSVEPIDADNSKKQKLNTEAPPEVINFNTAFNETADSLDESISTVNCSQESCVSEEDSLLIAKKDSPVHAVDPIISANEEEIKKIERNIFFYKKEIARLDELEVDDDSVNSPYIRSERLKSSVVILYKKLCELTGSMPSKRKGIRLQVIEGHPPGPTRILESFLNKNIDYNGDLPFPDFCDVVNCVTEANDNDDLGWTRSQIMKEAYLLFTHCGRALQKRRQNREYRDLLRKVKMEDTQKDPADDDPELLARLEENKRMSEKKELEILERYTMMQALPSKSKSQKKHDNNINSNVTDTHKALANNNNHSNSKNLIEQMDVDTRNCENQPPVEIEEYQSIVNSELKLKTDESEEPKQEMHIEISNKDTNNKVVDNVFRDNITKENDNCLNNNGIIPCTNSFTGNILPGVSPFQQNLRNKTTIDSSCLIDQKKTNTHGKMTNEDTKIDPVITIYSKQLKYNCDGQNNKGDKIANYDKSQTEVANLAVNCNSRENKENNEMNILITEIKQEPEDDIMGKFKSLGENFSITVETISDPFLIVEISSDSSDEE